MRCRREPSGAPCAMRSPPERLEHGPYQLLRSSTPRTAVRRLVISPPHRHEAAVGEGLAAARLRRDDLFLQTKFTYPGGQDHRLPYDPRAPLATQVEQSFTSSLQHLGVDVLDSYLLHGPSVARGLSADDWE